MNAELYGIDPSEIPDSVIMKSPLVQELSEALELGKFQVPIILKNKILMSEGRWNRVFYNSETIEKAWKQTDWSDRSRRDLYLDHSDQFAEGVTEWVGEVDNIHMSGGNLMGDLIIHDFLTAVKLQSGKPKVGVSPKVQGLKDNWKEEMVGFLFENFSIVLNPAVKNAYINNSENIEVVNMPVKDVKLEEEEGTEETPKEEAPKEEAPKEEAPSEETPKEGEGDSEKKLQEKKKGEVNKKKKKPYPYPEKTEGSDKMSEAKKLDSKIESIGSLLEDLKSERTKYDAPEGAKLSKLEEQMSQLAESVNEIKETVTLDVKPSVPDRRTLNEEGSVDDYAAKLAEIKSKGENQSMANFMKSLITGTESEAQ